MECQREKIITPSLNISKRFTVNSIVVLLSSLILLLFPQDSFGNHSGSSMQVKMNPFSLPKTRGVPGKEFRIDIQRGISINKDIKISRVRLEYETFDQKGGREILEQDIPSEDLSTESPGKGQYLVVTMPTWRQIKDIRTQSWGGTFVPYKAHLKIDYHAYGQANTTALPIGIPDARWAFIWGLIAVLASFFLIWALIRKSGSLGRTHGAARFFLFPLKFAITPLGTYSISITQILLWTYITIFGIVYVYFLTGACLEITSQLLMLLGIGGGTALAAKINAISKSEEIPSKYLDLVETTRREPELRNLICIGDKLNVFKFQILVFTLLAGYIVLMEIIQTRTFPLIPGNLIALMGLSSAVYLGNEVSQRDKKKLWEEVKQKIETIKKIALARKKPIETAKEVEALKINEVTELKGLLREIYS